MKYLKTITLPLLIAFTMLASCNNTETVKKEMKAKNVELAQIDGKYRLLVDGSEFFVQGAGLDDGDIATLAAHGANSFRTWMDSDVHLPAEEILEQAQKHGLLVMMGLPIGRERHGFDYSNEAEVQKQFEMIKAKVLAMKDHPALLGWGIGNELNLRSTNMKVWDAVEEIAAYIHEVDGMHPTTTMLAGIGANEVQYINENCPNLDFISIQMYGDIVNLADRIKDSGYTGPYLITEWGATGHWEVTSTSWGAPIENTSSEKARDFKHRYETAILSNKTHCLGSYVFLWGQKQERTPTWYGLFTEDNMETEAIDVMHYFWNDKWPENQSPKVIEATLNNKTRYDNIKLKSDNQYTTNYQFSDPDGDSLSVRIEIMHESKDLRDGGDLESKPDIFKTEIIQSDMNSTTFKSPSNPGEYRLFIYAYDDHNHVATVNIPFLIE